MGKHGRIAIFDPYNCQFHRDQDVATCLRSNASNGNCWIIEVRDEADERWLEEFRRQVDEANSGESAEADENGLE